MRWFTNWKKKYQDLVDRQIATLDLIEDYLYEAKLTPSEIKKLCKIYLTLNIENVRLIIQLHKDSLNRDLNSDTPNYIKRYKNTQLCKKRNVYVPILEKELKKLEKGKK